MIDWRWSIFRVVAGALLGLIFCAIIFPQYSDYREAAEMGRYFYQLSGLEAQVTAAATKQNSLLGAGKEINGKGFVTDGDFIYVDDAGLIVLQTRKSGAVLALIPEFKDGNINWRCLSGGSSHELIRKCRE